MHGGGQLAAGSYVTLALRPVRCLACCLLPQADGTVLIPEVLRPFMMGMEVIRPKKVAA